MGTDEIITKAVPGYEDKYEVSSDGFVWSLNYHREHRREKLKGKIDKDGYLEVCLLKDRRKMWRRVHRLIGETFIPNPDALLQINHKNGIKDDNRVKNLEWSTSSDNIKHSFNVLGKNQKGERNNNAKLSETQVIEIWKLKGVMTQVKIAEKFGIRDSSVDGVHSQKSWKWLTDTL